MANLTPEELNKLKKQLEEIEKLSQQFNRNINTLNLQPIEENAGAIKAIWEQLNKDLETSNDDTDYLVSNFQKLVGEIKKTSGGISESQRGLKGLSSIAEQVTNYQKGYNELSSKEIANLQVKSKLEFERLTRSSQLLADEKVELTAQLKGLYALDPQYKTIQNRLEKIAITQGIVNRLITNEDNSLGEINNQLEKSYQYAVKFEKAMGLGGSVIDGIGKSLNKLGLGKISDKLGIDDAQKKMKALSEEMIKQPGYVDSFSNKFKVLRTGLGSVGSSLITNLKDPLVIIGFLAKSLIDTLLSVDQQTGDLAKGFNLSYKEASNLRSELIKTANASGDINVTTKGLQESLMAVGQSLGTNAKLNEADLVTFTKLREQAGLTNEELIGMQKLTLATGGNLESNTKSLMAAAGQTAASNGLILNQKQLLQEVSKTSKSIQLSLAGNPEALGRAVAQAKALGMSLEQVNSIADKMLDIETSISSELEAELLTGKELNLEQARLYALNNDMEGLSKEIAKNFGSAAEFSKMNRIQQEAAAKAVGMSREELAGSLVEQQSLGKVSKEAFDARVKEVGLEKAQKELREGQFEKMMDQQSLQEKITASVEKLKEVFVSLVQPLMPVIDALSSVLGVIGKIVQFTGDWGKYILLAVGAYKVLQAAQKSSLLMSIGEAAMGVIKSSSFVPVIGTAIGLAAAAGVAALGYKYMKGNDVVSPGYGKRTLHGPEGAIALNDKDTVIAGTNLFDKKGDDTISEPGKSVKTQDVDTIKLNKKDNTTATSTTTSPSIDLSPLVNEMAAVKSILGQILTKEGHIYLDSTKLGTAINMGTSKIS